MPAKAKKAIRELKAAVKDAKKVYLAPDPDREGEAIAWHIVDELNIPPTDAARITFNEITANAVEKALREPTHIDMDRFYAQQARRVLDRLVGYKLSPLLWKKIAKGLSAGRVQSVALRLIVEREKEIQAFKPEEYWKFIATLSQSGYKKDAFTAELLRLDGKKAHIPNAEVASELEEHLQNVNWKITDIKKKTTSSRPGPPFNTAMLQQHAANKLGFSAKRTMAVAQKLYEGKALGKEGSVGLITYMRTDSYRISAGSAAEARKLIEQEWGEEYLPKSPRIIKAKKGAQDAHEAIRPTSAFRRPEKIQSFLTAEEYKLYSLIWHHFICSQMQPAKYEVINVDVEAGRAVFRANGRRLLFDGFLRAAYRPDKLKDQILPQMNSGDQLKLLQLDKSQNFTQPPARFTQATLVKLLEKKGIGRPSTYATIMSTIIDRNYVLLEKKKFKPTELGMLVSDKLVKHFPDIINVSFTSEMEEKLDKVETSNLSWVNLLREFYKQFSAALEKAFEEMEGEKNKTLDEKCPECGEQLMLRRSKYGQFISCSNWRECKYKRDEGNGDSGDEELDEKCPDCGENLVIKRGRRGKFIGCSGYPKCKYTRNLKAPKGDKLAGTVVEEVKCPKCESPMCVRYSRRGAFFGCTKFPKCKGMKKADPEIIERLKKELEQKED
ncbi:MAG: type I DNA topoisomerase [Planctomycetota bacterium]|nr:type I DNA topoisomerase [Planctomycetota bacterium]